MKTIPTVKLTITACAIALLTVSCASTESSTSDHKKEMVDNFSVPGSFLKREQQVRERQQSSQEQKAEEQFSQTQLASMGSLKHGSPLLTQAPQFASDEPVKVAVNEMTVPQLAHYVFGELLALSYVIAPDVERMKEKVALNIKHDVSPAELFQISRQILAQQKVEVYTKDNILYVGKSSDRVVDRAIGIGREMEDLPEAGDDIIQLVPYVYNSSRSIISIVSKLTNAQVYPDNTNRLLVMEGKRSDIERALQIVNMLDVPHAKGRDIRMLSLVYLSPEALIAQLQTLMAAEGINIGDDIALVSLNRLNSVVVYSSNRTLGDRVTMWAKTLDVPTGGESERFYVYRPQYAKAEELMKSMQSVIQPVSSGAGSDNADSGASTAGNRRSAGVSAPGVRINADEAQNALIINSSPSKYQEILALLEQLDRLPGQVALQVIVAEVDLTDNVSSGIDWFYSSNNNFAKSASLDLRSSTGTISFSGFNGDWRVALQMLATKTDIRVLSRPYLVVRDGESASINSGQQVPIITEFRDNDVSDTVRTSVQYRNTGISLSVTPTINADGLVSLQISQETSKSEPNTTSDISSPTISTRNISTNVLAGNGQTVVLGGLIKEDLTKNDSKVPLLGDIPLIGNLFRTKGNNFTRSELMVLITPRIIRDTTELDEFSRKLTELYSFPVQP